MKTRRKNGDGETCTAVESARSEVNSLEPRIFEILVTPAEMEK